MIINRKFCLFLHKNTSCVYTVMALSKVLLISTCSVKFLNFETSINFTVNTLKFKERLYHGVIPPNTCNVNDIYSKQ